MADAMPVDFWRSMFRSELYRVANQEFRGLYRPSAPGDALDSVKAKFLHTRIVEPKGQLEIGRFDVLRLALEDDDCCTNAVVQIVTQDGQVVGELKAGLSSQFAGRISSGQEFGALVLADEGAVDRQYGREIAIAEYSTVALIAGIASNETCDFLEAEQELARKCEILRRQRPEMPQLPFGNLDALVTRKGVAWTLVALAVAAILVALTPSGNDRLTSNRFLILFGVAAAIILGLAAIGIVVSLVEGWRNKLHRQQAFPLAWDDVIKQQEGHHRQLLGGRRARFEHSYSYLLSRDGVEGRTDVWCRSLGPWDYQAYILGNEWRGKRAAKFRELGAERCESPGCVNSDDLQVHHLTYLRLGRERLSDLVVLCMGCHALLHGHLPEMPENRGSLETDLEMGF